MPKRRAAADAAVVREAGAWVPCNELQLSYDRNHFEPMARDPDEVFRFVWENREALGLFKGAFSQVLSVRPCMRIGPDGFALRETVAEFYQVIRLRGDELAELAIEPPPELPADTVVPLYGGGTLIFDEYGRLKFYIHNSLDNAERQTRRLAHLWRNGALTETGLRQRDFARIHRLRTMDTPSLNAEEW